MDAVKEAQAAGKVRGLKGISPGDAAPRLDIDEVLVTQPDAFNLYLLALEELQQEKYINDRMGYYQIAGIHGLPRVYWDGEKIPRKDPKGGGNGMGYCAHSRPTFPTWHRPYLAMMEQSVYVKMAEIAERYDDEFKPKYRAAMRDFRLPYWDYYRPRQKHTTEMPGITNQDGTTNFNYDFSVPEIFTVESVMVRQYPGNELVPLAQNPLNHFKFPKSGGIPDSDWDLLKESPFTRIRTVRYVKNTSDLVGHPDALNKVVNRERESGATQILDMIKDYNSWASFATNSKTKQFTGSLENIHGTYHWLIGGPPSDYGEPYIGHMTRVPTAAFDPIFWMHHCQIDRWTAIWQAAHPDKFFDGEWREVKDGPLKPIASLAKEASLPFRHPNGGHWSGDLARNTKDFGYIYKDAQGNSPREVINNFWNLYSWAVRNRSRSGDYEKPPPGMEPLHTRDAQVFQYTAAGVADHLSRVAVPVAKKAVASAAKKAASFVNPVPLVEEGSAAANVGTEPVAPGTSVSSVALTNFESKGVDASTQTLDESKYTRDWYVDDEVERLALNGSFTIYYFIGKHLKEEPSEYAFQPTMAGINHVFTSTREACDNCGLQSEEEHLITGTKPVTPMLLDYVKIGELSNVTPENIVPFLINNLKWRIVGPRGDSVDPRTVPGFKVGISSKLTPLPGTEGGPLYEEYPQIVEQIIANSS